jgi:hypothetical protein
VIHDPHTIPQTRRPFEIPVRTSLDVCQDAVVGVRREGSHQTFRFAPSGAAIIFVPAKAGEPERIGALEPADLRALYGYWWQLQPMPIEQPAACIECHAIVDSRGCSTCAAVRPVWSAIRALDVIAFLEWWRSTPGKVSLDELPELARKIVTRDTRDERKELLEEVVKTKAVHKAVLGDFVAKALAKREAFPDGPLLVGPALDAYIHIRARLSAEELDEHLEDQGPGRLLRVDQTGEVFRGSKQAMRSTRPIQSRTRPGALEGQDLDVRVGSRVRPGNALAALKVIRTKCCAGCGEPFTTEDRREKYCGTCGSNAGRKALSRAAGL